MGHICFTVRDECHKGRRFGHITFLMNINHFIGFQFILYSLDSLLVVLLPYQAEYKGLFLVIPLSLAVKL